MGNIWQYSIWPTRALLGKLGNSDEALVVSRVARGTEPQSILMFRVSDCEFPLIRIM